MSRSTVAVIVLSLLAVLAIVSRGPNIQPTTTSPLGDLPTKQHSSSSITTNMPASSPTTALQPSTSQPQQQEQEVFPEFTRNTDDISSNSLLQDRNKVWRPHLCGSIFSTSERFGRGMMAKAGWNFSDGRVNPATGLHFSFKKRSSSSSRRYCAAWKVGVFQQQHRDGDVDKHNIKNSNNNNNNNNNNKQEGGGGDAVSSAATNKIRSMMLAGQKVSASSRRTILEQEQKTQHQETDEELEQMTPSPTPDPSRAWSKSMPIIWASGGGSRLPPLRCAVGPCLAAMIASRVDKLSRLVIVEKKKQQKNKEEGGTEGENILPRWILFAGDSRMRHLLARLVSMVRSQFAGGRSSSSSSEAERLEMNRPGVIEHYFHLNATYAVWGRRRRRDNKQQNADGDDDDDDYEILSDRHHILPEGQGCADDEIAMRDYPTTSSSSQQGQKNDQRSSNNIRMLFRICLWWVVSSGAIPLSGAWMMKTLQPVTMMWMPTLHECMGRNRRGKVRNGGYTKCGVDPRIVKWAAMEGVKVVANTAAVGGGLRNFLLLTTPNSQMAPKYVVSQRNKAVTTGFEQAARDLVLLQQQHQTNSNVTLMMMKQKKWKTVPLLEHVALRKLRVSTTNNDDAAGGVSGADQLPDIGIMRNRRENGGGGNQEQKQNDNDNNNNVGGGATQLLDKIDPTIVNSPKTLELWMLDQAKWWQVTQPSLCDFTHSMCNLKPGRPSEAGHMDFFCGQCRDEIGFVAVKEMLRILLS